MVCLTSRVSIKDCNWVFLRVTSLLQPRFALTAASPLRSARVLFTLWGPHPAERSLPAFDRNNAQSGTQGILPDTERAIKASKLQSGGGRPLANRHRSPPVPKRGSVNLYGTSSTQEYPPSCICTATFAQPYSNGHVASDMSQVVCLQWYVSGVMPSVLFLSAAPITW